MYIFGKVRKLSSIDKDLIKLSELKKKFEILVIDDNPLPAAQTLKNSGFQIHEMRDITEISMVEKYPIVACDIDGIGTVFRKNNGGIYVLSEIRKYYPDKFLILYSTKTQDIDGSLIKADVIFPKDTSIDTWQNHIETALVKNGNPKSRWLRIRKRLSEDGVDAYEIFLLEQAYIESIEGNDPEGMKNRDILGKLSPASKDLIIKFVTTTIIMGFKELLK
ncbi:hypothetical protein [Lonsdalea quercina]|uniref:hypothetical protein n=1 Tax=Lonsdalea quercina TaxID=71657 RepID=UPI0039757CCD